MKASPHTAPGTWTLQSGTEYASVAMDQTGQFQAAIVFHPIEDNTVVYSRDFGVTWTASTGITGNVSTISMSPDGNIVIVGVDVNASPAYISTDYGTTFTGTDPLASNWSVVGVEYNNYMIACDYIGDVATVYLSQNQGTNWSAIASYSGYYITYAAWSYGDGMNKIYTIGYHTNSPYVTSLNVTTDRGTTWTTITSISSYNLSGVACDSTGQYVVVSASQDGIYRSADYGATWVKTTAPNFAPSGPSMGYIACDQRGNQITVMDSVNYAVYASSDAGTSWVLQTTTGSNGASDVLGLSMSPDGSYRYASFIGVGTYSNIVPAWQTVSFSTSGYNPLLYVACNNYSGQHMAAIGSTQYGNGKCLVYSTDYGLTWGLSDADASGDSIYTCMAASANGQYVVAGYQNGPNGVVFSNNYGIHYSIVTTGLNFTPTAIAISNDGQYFYAVCNDSLEIYAGSLAGAVVAKVLSPVGMHWKSVACDSTGSRVYATAQDDYAPYYLYSADFSTPYIYLPLNGSTDDVMTNSTITPVGSIGYVAGIASQYAVNLSNSAGNNASNYILGTWSGSSDFTLSLWFNAQSSGTTQTLFSAYGTALYLYLNGSNHIVYSFPSGGGTNSATITGPTITSSTWYYVTILFQTGGTCALYLNNVLVDSQTNVSGVGSRTTNHFGIGTYDISDYGQAFNGYIDDFKIYDTAGAYGVWTQIPNMASFPVLPLSVTCDSTGAIVTVSAGTDGVYQSVDSGASWAQKTSLTAPTIHAVSYAPFSPVQTSLASTSWTQNHVQWTASASTYSTGQYPYIPFDNLVNNGWVTTSGTYTTSGNTSGISNTFYTNGNSTLTVEGDWLQLQSSIPLVMSSYVLGCTNSNNLPSKFYIVGSNDGTNWYALQHAVASGQPAGLFSTITGTIHVNSTSTQTWGTTTLVTTAYTGSARAYTSFRMIVLSSFYGPGTVVQLAQWDISFLPSTVPAIISPQQSNLASDDWTQNGVQWTATGSSRLDPDTFPYHAAFNNYYGSSAPYSWVSGVTYQGGGGAYNGSVTTTVLGGIGSVSGEWIQLQTSTPLIMDTYSYASGGYNNLPRIYYIVGSNDGTSWYPIQHVTMTTNPITANFTACSTYLTVNQSGTQTITGNQVGSGTFTTYPTTGNSFTYFRAIATAIYANGPFEFNEWFINFHSDPNVLVIPPTITPDLPTINSNSWTKNGTTWASSASSFINSYYAPWIVFNGAYDLSSAISYYSWASAGNYNTGTGVYNNTYSTTVLSGVGTVYGEWIQLHSSTPQIMDSYSFSCGGIGNLPKTYYIVGSQDGSSWYPIHSATMAANACTSGFTSFSNYIVVNQTGTQTVTAGTTTTVSTIAYRNTAQTYTYFRLIATSTFGIDGNFELEEWHINFAGRTTPIVHLPLVDSLVDLTGNSTVTSYGTIAYAPSQVGTYAANLVNSAGSSAGNYIRGTIPGVTTFSVSGWFNVQSVPGSGSISVITSIGASNGNCAIMSYTNGVDLNGTTYNGITFYFYNAAAELIVVGNYPSVSLNTWYSFTYIISTTGTCYAYVNHTLAGSVFGQPLYRTTSIYSIGCGTGNTAQAFNGYIADYQIYNAALPAPSLRSLTMLASDSTGSTLVAADTAFQTLYRSTDSGATWEAQIVDDVNGNAINTVSVDPTGTYAFAFYQYAGAFMNQRSASLTTSWTVKNGAYRPRMTFSVDNQYQTAISLENRFTSTGHSIISYSTDSGATWTDGADLGGYILDIAANSTGQYVVAVLEIDMTGSPSVYRSTDYGATFTVLANSPIYQQTGINCIACDSTGDRIYVGSYDGNVFVSTNAGVDWVSHSMQNYVYCITCSHSGEDVYALVSDELCVSTNHGQTWSSLLPISNGQTSQITCDWTGSIIVAACYNSGIFRSIDKGQTWTPESIAPITPNNGNGQNYFYITCNSTGNRILAMDVNSSALYLSTDAGTTWTYQYTPGSRTNEAFMGVSMSPDGTRYAAEFWAPGTYSLTAGAPDLPNAIPCFLEGSQILCKVAGVDTYVNVETIRPGMLVKTSRDGYKAVKLIGSRAMTNSGLPNKNSLYLCTKAAYPELLADLTLTGCHAILVPQITDAQRAGILSTLQRVFVTDKQYRLPTCVDERASVVQTEGNFIVWHFALEHYDIRMNYGVYAQGLLVESSPICHMNTKNYTLVQ